MALMDVEGKERIKIDADNLGEWMKSIRGISKMELDQMMCDYICDSNTIKEDEIRVIRNFVKYLKEQ